MPTTSTVPASAAAAAAPSMFRVESAPEVLELLQQLIASGVTLNLSSPLGDTYTAVAITADPSRGVLCLSAEAQDTQVQNLLQSQEVVAVGYLDSVKLQFDLHDLVLVRGAGGSALNVRIPHEIYRFQRRNGYRVRPLFQNSPTATLTHPDRPDLELQLRVLDVSIGGLALLLPDTLPAIEPGVRIEHVVIALDGDTRIVSALNVHHITHLHHESQDARIGCEFPRLDAESSRKLQRYIEQTQKKRRQMVL